MRDVKRTFLEFMDRVPFYGMVVACNDDPLLRGLLPEVQRRIVTYGTKRGSDFLIKLASPSAISGQASAAKDMAGMGSSPDTSQPLSRFRVSFQKKDLGEFALHVPGVHNILNATAAIAVGVGLDVGVDAIRAALSHFRGVDRRFQLRGRAAGVSVIDDYGHHPTEIKATLAAARSCGFGKVHVVFQPHRYTRTRDLMEEFTTAFGDADSLFVLDIYAASEKPIEGISGEALAQAIRDKGGVGAEYAGSFADAAVAVAAMAKEGDMILTLGAGSVSQLGPMVLESLGGAGLKVPGLV
jgi:UDP-N-acetylmuramate--alanine ligase